MLIIRNRAIPFGKSYGAINLFGILFVKRGMRLTPETLNHEKIHTAQMLELLFVPFYLIYVAEWLMRLVGTRGRGFDAYCRISFEREAYRHQSDNQYLLRRRHYAQWRRG